MQTLETFLASKREVTINTIASYLREVIQERWETVLQENLPELLQLFEKAGEPTYGVYGQKLLGPVFEQIKRMGFGLESGSGSPPTHSVEYWGPPEERERCIWSIVKRADGTRCPKLTHLWTRHKSCSVPASTTTASVSARLT
jgi:Family of unknown function (DUF6022)